MSSKERTARLKDKLRKDILCAAMSMLKSKGRHSLSLRKIADDIEYTAPIIYSYFENKEAILMALSKLGYEQLNLNIRRNCDHIVDPVEKLITLLTTYWNFAIKERELYQLMYDIGTGLDNITRDFPELTEFLTYLRQTISALYGENTLSDKLLQCKSYTSAAVIHGLISANLFWKHIDSESNKIMLNDVIIGVVKSLNKGI